jgi:phosphoribosyl 1,2-cyclic phosphodiesterase
MPSEPIFTVTYWGATGAFETPLSPHDVTDKLVRAMVQLAGAGRLADLRPGSDLEATVRRRVEEHVAFDVRSTYGGNTTCVSVQTPDALLILDAGGGMRLLGVELEQRWNAPDYHGPRSAHVLITHAHTDHISAIPFFGPFYDARNDFRLWGSRSVLDSLEAIFSPGSPLSHTYFPHSYDWMTSLRGFGEVRPGEAFAIGSTRVLPHGLNHPGGALGYRLECGGRSFVFATDHEQAEVPDRALAEFVGAADLLYLDGQYLTAEHDGQAGIGGQPPLSRRGWGHSTVEACVVTAVAAGVRVLHIGHREPRRTDAETAAVEAHLRGLLAAELKRVGRGLGECTAHIVHEGLCVRV